MEKVDFAIIGQCGFLEEVRRSNVAITRARRHLALIGDSDTLSHEPFLKGMLEHCSEKGEVWSAQDYINGNRCTVTRIAIIMMAFWVASLLHTLCIFLRTLYGLN